MVKVGVSSSVAGEEGAQESGRRLILSLMLNNVKIGGGSGDLPRAEGMLKSKHGGSAPLAVALLYLWWHG